MTEIRLTELKISNFKGIRSFDFAPMGQSMSIYGDNATGKTSVYDALMWLLFDRDSRENAQFDIKPLDSEGNVLSPGTVSEVEAALSINGEELVLKKTYYEKWSQKRGSAEKTFDGNTSDYFVDGVPVKKKEYEARIAEIIDRETFRLLTNVNYFAEALPWQKRREVLFDICAMPEDRDIMATDERFSELIAKVGRGSVDDLRKKLTARRKGLNEIRIKTPGKLDTLEKTMEPYLSVDYEAAEDELSALEAKRQELEERRADAQNGFGLSALKEALSEAKNALVELRMRNADYREVQMRGVKPDDTGEQLAEAQSARAKMTRILLERQEEIETEENRVCALRAEWKKAAGEEWSGETVCPTCGREYDEANIGRAKADFEAHKADKLKRITTDANKAKLHIADLEGQNIRLSEELKILDARIEALEKKKAAAPVRKIEDMPGYDKQTKELIIQIETAKETLENAKTNENAAVRVIEDEIGGVKAKIRDVQTTLAGREFIKNCESRMEEARREAAEASREMEETDRIIYLCEEFVKYKVSFVTEAVNEKFALARFKLFNIQVNGGITDCCEVTYEGANFGSNLNSGARICVGMDIINTLSEAFGVSVPLFVDNAESVTALPPMDTQVVRLVVSAEDKELRCEVWD